MAAQSALDALRVGARLCLSRELTGLVTAPVSKEAILRSGEKFVGQTEFLAEFCHCQRFAMMLLGHDDRGRWLRVALATTHVPVKDIASTLTVASVRQAIELAVQSTRRGQ